MDLMKIGSQLLMQKLGGGGNADAVQSALGSLLGGGSGGGPDIASLVGNLQQNGLGEVAKSWLGDGANAEISADQVKSLFGSEKIQQVASQLGSDEGSVLSGLQEMLPQMVDKSSSGGSLLDSVGGLGGAMDALKKFT